MERCQRQVRSSIRRLVLAGSAVALAVGSVIVGVGVGTTQIADAQGSPVITNSCSYASNGGTSPNGPRYAHLCWLNFAGYSDTTASNGIPYVEKLPHGYTLSFTLTRTNVAGDPQPQVSAVTSPTAWPSAAFGRDAYVGISSSGNQPILYSSPLEVSLSHKVAWRFTLSNLSLKTPQGVAMKQWKFVAADAESTNSGESVTFTTSGGPSGSRWGPVTGADGNSMVRPLSAPGASTAGEPSLRFKNTCGGGYSGIYTPTVTCVGNSANLVGDLVLKTLSPTTVSATDSISMSGQQQGVAFAVITPGGLTLTKTEAAGPNPITSAGQQVTYEFTVKNTGMESVNVESVADTQAIAGEKLNPGGTCPGMSAGAPQLLTPGQSFNCTATYTVTTADIAAGAVRDTAQAMGIPRVPIHGQSISYETGNPILSCKGSLSIPVKTAGSVTPPAPTTSAAVVTPGLSLTKTEAPGSPNPITRAGQSITYDFGVTNTGNTTLNHLAITDTQSVAGETLSSPASCPVTSLAAGASVTCTGSYTVTSTDISNGKVTDTATATATTTTGASVTSNPATLTIPVVVPTTAPSTVTPTTKPSSVTPTTKPSSVTPTPVRLVTGPPVPPSSASSALPIGLAIAGLGLGGLGYVVIERRRHNANGHNNEVA